ncbi:MAG: hypothetical protein IKI50_03190 [Clostridia bacterium]|nr:hypothetical protein [Clostridia bacterium]MBR7092173.1 hypothetical protein [Clostridia bacterium]
MDVMDSFVEQIVPRKNGARQWFVIVAVTLAAALLCAFLLLFLLPYVGVVAIVPVIALIALAWWIVSGQSTECEYCITNGDLDIDLIIARRKRRRMVSVHGVRVEKAAPYRPELFADRYDRTVMAASSPEAPDVWAFTYRSKKNGYTLVLFEPNERVLDAFLRILPRSLQIEARRQAGIL